MGAHGLEEVIMKTVVRLTDKRHGEEDKEELCVPLDMVMGR